MTLQYHEIKALKDFLVVKLKLYHHPSKLSDHRYFGIGNIIALVSHMILQDHVIKESYDDIIRSLSR